MSAIKRIEKLKETGQIRKLGRVLKQGDVVARRRAAQALGELGDTAAVDFLAHASWTDRDVYVRRWSVEALGRIGSEDAIRELIDVLFSTNNENVRLAEQVLATIPAPRAEAALNLKEILPRHDWEALEDIGPDGKVALGQLLDSEQYLVWPSARRQRMLALAVRLGITPPAQHRDELSRMGLYVPGVHRIGDLLRGLRHRNPTVRTAAITAMEGSADIPWVKRRLYKQFQYEIKPEGDNHAAATIARILEQAGDTRAIRTCKERLLNSSGSAATEAAYVLADAASPVAVEALFWYAADASVPRSSRNMSLALGALQRIGPDAVDVLLPVVRHPMNSARKMLVDVIENSRHPESAILLGALCRDKSPQVQDAALNALSGLNTVEAVQTLRELTGRLPDEKIIAALSRMTHPDGLAYLRELSSDVTTLSGVLTADSQKPIAGADVQVLQEHYYDDQATWGWMALSVRGTTGDAGRFALAVPQFDPSARLRLKVVLPLTQDEDAQDTYTADITLKPGQAITVQAQVNRFLNLLVITQN